MSATERLANLPLLTGYSVFKAVWRSPIVRSLIRSWSALVVSPWYLRLGILPKWNCLLLDVVTVPVAKKDLENFYCGNEGKFCSNRALNLMITISVLKIMATFQNAWNGEMRLTTHAYAIRITLDSPTAHSNYNNKKKVSRCSNSVKSSG